MYCRHITLFKLRLVACSKLRRLQKLHHVEGFRFYETRGYGKKSQILFNQLPAAKQSIRSQWWDDFLYLIDWHSFKRGSFWKARLRRKRKINRDFSLDQIFFYKRPLSLSCQIQQKILAHEIAGLCFSSVFCHLLLWKDM